MAVYQVTDQGCKNGETWASNIALSCILVGIIMVLMSFLWPVNRNFAIDPTLSAQENENNQANHASMMTTLYTVEAVGMGLLTTGGIITSILLTKVLLQEECFHRVCIPQSRRRRLSQDHDMTTLPEDGACSHQKGGASGSIDKPLPPLPNSGPGADKDSTRLAESDHLERNKDVSGAKQYGSLERN